MLYNVDWSKPFPAPINEGLIRPLVETGLKLITVGGAGYDRVDVDYLTASGVLYANNPRTVMHRTADSTAMMILMACKGATQQERSLREGKWANRALKGKNPRGLTLGIVGMGNIGAIGEYLETQRDVMHAETDCSLHNPAKWPRTCSSSA